MNYMYSLNATGNSQTTVVVNFDVKTDPNNDLILTQSRETQAASQLPADVNNYGVTVQKSATAPLMLVGLYSPKGTRKRGVSRQLCYINLNDPIGRLPGVGHAQVFGAGQYAMRLWVKPDHLAELGNTRDGHRHCDPVAKYGESRRPDRGQPGTQEPAVYLFRSRSRPPDLARAIRQHRGARAPNGGVVRVKDVARVELGAQDYSMVSRLNGKPSAIVAVYQLPGSNAVETAAAVRKLDDEMKQRLPGRGLHDRAGSNERRYRRHERNR
jgi:hydrophobic/amphiphilic exporter-1 (mainly G- bacteria), HAE1 family